MITRNNNRREIAWGEENRIQEITDNGKTTSYWYDDAGECVFKRGSQGEMAYASQFYVIRGGSVATKHFFIGAGADC